MYVVPRPRAPRDRGDGRRDAILLRRGARTSKWAPELRGNTDYINDVGTLFIILLFVLSCLVYT